MATTEFGDAFDTLYVPPHGTTNRTGEVEKFSFDISTDASSENRFPYGISHCKPEGLRPNGKSAEHCIASRNGCTRKIDRANVKRLKIEQFTWIVSQTGYRKEITKLGLFSCLIRSRVKLSIISSISIIPHAITFEDRFSTLS